MGGIDVELGRRSKDNVYGLETIPRPPQYERILARSREVAFAMNSDVLTGSLLRTLAASKPGSAMLELGTGCGLGASWILEGMDASSSLTSVDTDPRFQSIAAEELGADRRLTLVQDGGEFLDTCDQQFDLIYADAWPGKYSHLEKALALLNRGGIYVGDDMLPQSNWPEGHGAKAEALLARFDHLDGFAVTKLSWSTGLIVAVRR
jgi:predicted O-methyltransferase YrrM